MRQDDPVVGSGVLCYIITAEGYTYPFDASGVLHRRQCVQSYVGAPTGAAAHGAHESMAGALAVDLLAVAGLDPRLTL